MAQTVLLALDADSAGQEAMLKASRLASEAQARAARRRAARRQPTRPSWCSATAPRRCRPRSTDAVAVRALSRRARPRERRSHRGPRARPDARRAAPGVRELPPSAMRMELTRIVSSRFALPARRGREAAAPRAARAGAARVPDEQTAAERAAGAAPRRPPGAGGLSRREDTERAFLALCIASPEQGARRARRTRRRAALHQRAAAPRRAAPARGDLRAPMADAAGTEAARSATPS